jgi:AmmeMemoRadiSam system protein B
VLGTNHFGIGDGVVLTEWGFRSPLGDVETDAALQADLRDRFGERAIADQLDHVGEHSIQLHLPWVQHLFGTVPVIGALIPDPLSDLIEDDGKRIGADEFVDGLRAALDAAGGRTLVVASSDLSHVGPQFGEPRKVDEERRGQVETHDREMLKRFLEAEPSEFLETVEWNRNPTRWCSVGNMAAAKRLVAPKRTELIDYRQAVDDQGIALVSAAAMVMTA